MVVAFVQGIWPKPSTRAKSDREGRGGEGAKIRHRAVGSTLKRGRKEGSHALQKQRAQNSKDVLGMSCFSSDGEQGLHSGWSNNSLGHETWGVPPHGEG